MKTIATILRYFAARMRGLVARIKGIGGPGRPPK